MVPPPPGISKSIWDVSPWETPMSQPQVTIPSHKPPSGRGDRLRANLRMRGLVPQEPQMAPAIHQPQMAPAIQQPRPVSSLQQATPYEQTVYPPRRPGLRVTYNSSATKPAPTESQDTSVRGRPASRGRDDNTQSASSRRGGREASSGRKASSQQERGCPIRVTPHNPPPSSTPGSATSQQGGGPRSSPRNPL